MIKKTENLCTGKQYASPRICAISVRTQAALLTSNSNDTGFESLTPDTDNDFDSIF